jgi:predicted dehydrogenase
MGLPLRIAVVGSGIGASHIEGFHELPNLFEIKILCDVSRERATAVAEKHRIQEVDCAAMSIEIADGSLGTISVTLGSAVEISRHRFTFSTNGLPSS